MKKVVCSSLAGLVLLAIPALADTKSIAKDEVNVRSGPSLESPIVFRAPVGYPIKIEKENGQWVFFRDWENDTGWVYKPLVSDVQTVVVMADKTNVRSLPGTNHKIVAKASRGEIYKVLEKDGNWVKIGYYAGDEVIGWIRQDLVFGN